MNITKTETVSIKVEDCPFCGNTEYNSGFGIRRHPTTLVQIICKVCGGCGPERNDEIDALNDWNSRASIDKARTCGNAGPTGGACPWATTCPYAGEPWVKEDECAATAAGWDASRGEFVK